MEKLRTLSALVMLAIGVVWVKPVLAEEYYCCAYCQGGNNTPTICVIGSCYWYESQKCSYYTRLGQTLCRQTIDTILCPRLGFTANPWASDENGETAKALPNLAE